MEYIQHLLKLAPRSRLKPRMQLLDRAGMTVWWFIFAKPTADMPFSWQAPTSRPLLRTSRGRPSTSASSTAISAGFKSKLQQKFPAGFPTRSPPQNTNNFAPPPPSFHPHFGTTPRPDNFLAVQRQI